MINIGIDPGKEGAIAVIYNKHNVDIYRIPMAGRAYNYKAIRDIFIHVMSYDPKETVVLTVEQIVFYSSKFANAIQSLSDNANRMIGIFYGLGNFNISQVKTLEWKRYFNVSKDKQTVVEKALELYPLTRSTIYWKHKIKDGYKSTELYPDDNMAEAILIAEYARRNNFYIDRKKSDNY